MAYQDNTPNKWTRIDAGRTAEVKVEFLTTVQIKADPTNSKHVILTIAIPTKKQIIKAGDTDFDTLLPTDKKQYRGGFGFWEERIPMDTKKFKKELNWLKWVGKGPACVRLEYSAKFGLFACDAMKNNPKKFYEMKTQASEAILYNLIKNDTEGTFPIYMKEHPAVEGSNPEVSFEPRPEASERDLAYAWQRVDIATTMRLARYNGGMQLDRLLSIYVLDAIPIQGQGSFGSDSADNFGSKLAQIKNLIEAKKAREGKATDLTEILTAEISSPSLETISNIINEPWGKDINSEPGVSEYLHDMKLLTHTDLETAWYRARVGGPPNILKNLADKKRKAIKQVGYDFNNNGDFDSNDNIKQSRKVAALIKPKGSMASTLDNVSDSVDF